VFSYATKVLTALTGSALVGAGVYYATVGEHAGALLLAFVGVAAVLALLTVVGSGVVDVAPHIPADAPAPERRKTTPGAAGKPSGWPLAAAGAMAVLATGAATNAAVLDAGIIAVLLASLGWFAKAWTDHPTWTPRVRSRISDRFVAPLGLPVGGFVMAAIIAISVSRILLAIPERVAPLIALVVAVLILGACAWVSTRPRIASSALIALSAIAGVSVIGAGIAGATQGERKFEEKAAPVEPLVVHAKNVNFMEKRLEAPANTEVTLRFTNEDAGTYHNVAVYQSATPDAAPIFNGRGFPGANTEKYTFKTPGPGQYTFRCDFHANMVGTFVVGGS
jgi:plastocyanin